MFGFRKKQPAQKSDYDRKKSEIDRTRNGATAQDWSFSHGCKHSWVFDDKKNKFGMERTYYHCANCGMSGREDYSRAAGMSQHIW